MTNAISIDPGPKLSGLAVHLKGVWRFEHQASLELIKSIRTPLVLVEVTDFPIHMAGDSYRDTCITVGRLMEFFLGKSTVIQLGRKATVNQLPPEFTRNDSGMKQYCKSQGFNKLEGLKEDAWQALGQLLIYNQV